MKNTVFDTVLTLRQGSQAKTLIKNIYNQKNKINTFLSFFIRIFQKYGEIFNERNYGNYHRQGENRFCGYDSAAIKYIVKTKAKYAGGQKRHTCGYYIYYRLYFAAHTGCQGYTFFKQQISNEKNTEFPVYYNKKQKSRQDSINHKTEEKGYLC